MSEFQNRYVNYLLHSGYTEDELIHYGVLGMKWGIRKLNKRWNASSKLRDRVMKKTDGGRVYIEAYDKQMQKAYGKYAKQYKKLNERLKGSGYGIRIDTDYLGKTGRIRYFLDKVDKSSKRAYEISGIDIGPAFKKPTIEIAKKKKV